MGQENTTRRRYKGKETTAVDMTRWATKEEAKEVPPAFRHLRVPKQKASTHLLELYDVLQAEDKPQKFRSCLKTLNPAQRPKLLPNNLRTPPIPQKNDT